MKFSNALKLLLILMPCLLLTPVVANEALQTPEFMRWVDQPGHKALQVSVVTYQPRTGGDYSVDLVGAVHVGDRSYYHHLNDMFKQYDVVLYELVAPSGTVIPKGGIQEGGGVVTGIQRTLKDVLGLTFQMEEVDYTPKHFVHADFSPEEFSASMEKKGESIFSMVFTMWRASLSQQLSGQGGASNVELLMALFSADRKNALKELFAKELVNSGGMMEMLEGSEGSTIVAERNKKALQVLRQEMPKGHKTYAIFYGAAHLPDFHDRLVSQFDLVPTNTRWIDAWLLH